MAGLHRPVQGAVEQTLPPVRTTPGPCPAVLWGEMESLWLFLSEPGVEPTNNRAERALRYGVLWRKRSLGTQSENGDRWAERIMSLRHTCRMHDIPVYPRLVRILSDQSQRPTHRPDLDRQPGLIIPLKAYKISFV